MPAGVSWSRYLKFAVSAALCTFAGAQLVHYIYRPLDDLDALIRDEEQKLKQKEALQKT